jgi:hypothetical protein
VASPARRQKARWLVNHAKRIAALERDVVRLQREKASANRQADALVAYLLDLLRVLAEQRPGRTSAQCLQLAAVHLRHRRLFEGLQARERLEALEQRVTEWRSAVGADAPAQ